MEKLEARLQAKRKEQKESAVKQMRLIKRNVEIAAASPEGLNLLKWIFDLSGYSKVLIAGNPQIGLNVLEGTLYNNARRSLWLEIRQLIPARTLKKIEHEKLNLNLEEL